MSDLSGQVEKTISSSRDLFLEIVHFIKLKSELYGRFFLFIIISLQLIFIFLIGIWVGVMIEVNFLLLKLGLSLAGSIGILILFNFLLIGFLVGIILYRLRDV